MAYNVFTQPRKAFEHAIDAPSIGIAFVIVLLTGIIWSATSLILFNDIFNAAILIAMNIIQWLVLSILLFAFEILFSGQKKHQIRADFSASATVVGKLYIYALITVILLNVFAFFGSLFIATIIGILILIVSILSIVASFIAVKVVLDSSNARALVAWVLLIIVYFLVIFLANLITNAAIVQLV